MNGANPMSFSQVKEKVRVGASRAGALSHAKQRLTISVEEAGRILGVSRGAAYAKDGSIPTIRLGKRLLVPKAALEKMLNVA
jgi:excisionase family DNA binding protein